MYLNDNEWQRGADQASGNYQGLVYNSAFWSQIFGGAGFLGASIPMYGCPALRDPTPDDDGWIDWMTWLPPYDKLIQYTREEWDAPSVGYSKDLNPEMNVYGLKWRLTGIAKGSV